jgi:hypothetical protein
MFSGKLYFQKTMFPNKIETCLSAIISMPDEIDYSPVEITYVCMKINTIVIQLKDILIVMKKDDFVGIVVNGDYVRFIFKNIRYRAMIPYGDKRQVITNQLSEVIKKLDELDNGTNNANTEIAELREKYIMLEETVKKLKAKEEADAVGKLSRDINHVEADLLGLNT